MDNPTKANGGAACRAGSPITLQCADLDIIELTAYVASESKPGVNHRC